MTVATDAVSAFLAWAEHDRGRAANTLIRFRSVLSQVAVETECDPAYATREQIEQWWATRYDMAPATRNNELACLRSFYRWLARFHDRADDPTRRIDPPKIPHKMPRPMGETDLDRLLAASKDTPDVRRALCLGAYAGLRIGEAAACDWSWVDVEARRIYVMGKGSKERAMGLSPLLLDKLLPDTGGNVVTAGQAPYKPAVLQKRVNRFIQRTLYLNPDTGRLVLPDNALTFHALRKRAATLAIAKTGNIHAVADAFGWESIETAATYAVAQGETLDAIAAAVQ